MEDIMIKQLQFQKLLNNDVASVDFQRLMFLGLYEETGEAGKETKIKAHKKQQEFNKEKFITELSDVQIYLLNLLLSADCSWKEFENIVRKKVEINFERQKNGY